MAIKEATKGMYAGHGGPFGAVIVKNGKVVSKGHNKVIKNNDPTQHSEMQAITKAGKKLGTFDLRGCDMYATGEPCPMCLVATMWANIDNVYYGCTIKDNEKIGFRDRKFEKIVHIDRSNLKNMHQIDRDACLELFERYNKMKNKVIY